jgi:myo-inositol 2-dehydrogenase/D-chiro-inositol 1-dehydrogenase
MTPTPRVPSSPASLNRRGFVAGLGSGAAGALVAPRLSTAAVGGGPTPGRRATIRVALVGCGGRGTGAAVQAVRASRDIRIYCLADLFPDHLAESTAILARVAGGQFECPSRRRFVGPDAWRQAIESDVDLVILATHPAARPAQFAAAVRAGRHVYCEPPAAVDLAGIQLAATALAEARQRGLAVVAGLPGRHDQLLANLILRLGESSTQAAVGHQDGIGRPLHAAVAHHLGMPWIRRVPAQERSREYDLVRNWITAEKLSGGPFVERLVHAIDRALWVFGDECPIAALPLEPAGCRDEFPKDSGKAGASRVAARFVYADGRGIDAVIDRRPRGISHRTELIEGTHGRIDLARHGDPRPAARHPLQVAMDRLIGMIRDTGPEDRTGSAAALVRSTLAAVLGRTAVETGRSVAWPLAVWPTEGLAQSVQGARPIQCVWS